MFGVVLHQHLDQGSSTISKGFNNALQVSLRVPFLGWLLCIRREAGALNPVWWDCCGGWTLCCHMSCMKKLRIFTLVTQAALRTWPSRRRLDIHMEMLAFCS